MNADELKKEIDSIFPCRWGDDFLRDFQKTLDRYFNMVSCLENVTENIKDEIKNLCNQLVNVLNHYYDGRKGEAFNEFSTIMNGTTDTLGLFSSIDSVDINPEEFYYRTRERKPGVEFSIQDMFHIPLNKRGIVSTQR